MAMNLSLMYSFFMFVIFAVGASLQITAYVNLRKSAYQNKAIADATKILLSSAILGFTSIVVVVISMLLIAFSGDNGHEAADAMLGVSTFAMFVSGVLGATAATQIQCYHEANKELSSAWMFSSISAVVGIVGTMALLLSHSFTHKNTLKTKLIKLLQEGPQKPKAVKQVGSAVSEAIKTVKEAPARDMEYQREQLGLGAEKFGRQLRRSANPYSRAPLNPKRRGTFSVSSLADDDDE